jgi:hypothetical protein
MRGITRMTRSLLVLVALASGILALAPVSDFAPGPSGFPTCCTPEQ